MKIQIFELLMKKLFKKHKKNSNSYKKLKSIGNDAFSDCSLLIDPKFYKKAELTLIGKKVFINLPLIEIKI